MCVYVAMYIYSNVAMSLHCKIVNCVHWTLKCRLYCDTIVSKGQCCFTVYVASHTYIVSDAFQSRAHFEKKKTRV